MPTDLKQVRALMGGINYYRNFLPYLSKRFRPINSLLRKGVTFLFMPAMEKLVSSRSLLLCRFWSFPIGTLSPTAHARSMCTATLASKGLVAALPQEQADGSLKPIAYISRATLDSERHWTPLHLEASSIVWALKRLKAYLWRTKFHVLSDDKTLESIGKVGNYNARVQRWLEFFNAFDHTLEYRKGSANDPNFLSHLPEPAMEHDRSRSTTVNL